METVDRRAFLPAVILLIPALAASVRRSLRGKLRQRGGKAFLETAAGSMVALEGDDPTTGVLKDERLAGADLEVMGEAVAPDRFVVGPIHTKAMFVHKDGKRLLITYWCDVCSIRTYTPGKCWCCQQETQLDLRESVDQ